MKKLLIFGYTMEMGGAEKALVDTLNYLHSKVEIDLYLLEKKGSLMSSIPKDVNVYQMKNNKFIYALFRFVPFFRKKYINKIANKKDYNNYLKNLRLSEDMLRFAKQEALKLDLGMNFISADVTLDNKHLLYQFVADERIDFRELAKAIAGKYKLRVELRQIGARDKAKLIDGIGPCGRRLCCTSFLDKLDSISMNMAKNQGLALNPSKINGACGRLMCCLTYENDNYTECRKQLPEVGKMVETEYGIGKVVSEDVLNLKYTVNINNELKEIKVADNGNRKE
mgnify:CR=1 FL=1